MSKKVGIPLHGSDGDEPLLEGHEDAEKSHESAEGGERPVEERKDVSEGDALEERDADFSRLNREDLVRDAELLQQKESLAGEVAELRRKVDETHDKYLRALADFENYKKRALKERSDLLKYQGEKVLYDMADVADDLERALSHAGAGDEHLKAGLELVYKNFVGVLNKWGVRGESGVGQPFDPNKFNAISKVRVEGVAQGIIISELKKAYFYKDKLLRPGDVVVADGGTSGASPGETAPSSAAAEGANREQNGGDGTPEETVH